MAKAQVATKPEILPGTMKAVLVDDAEILVAHCEDGFYAVSGICTHMGGHLVEGELNSYVVTCPRHGARFDVRTGANVGPAKIAALKMRPSDLRSYPVTVENEAIMVTID
jgi:3-phenylpropionate/trans-cinnamate dioxygenase ferredoxin subunit